MYCTRCYKDLGWKEIHLFQGSKNRANAIGELLGRKTSLCSLPFLCPHMIGQNLDLEDCLQPCSDCEETFLNMHLSNSSAILHEKLKITGAENERLRAQLTLIQEGKMACDTLQEINWNQECADECRRHD